MRALGILVTGVTVLGVAVACGSSDTPGVPIGEDGDSGASTFRPTHDAGAAADGSPNDGGSGDGSVCATPFDATCCAAGQGCADDGTGKRSCVTTCVNGKDCASGCCAPAVNKAGNPVGPYVCMPDDTKAYHCCTTNFTFCPGDDCCIMDTQGNEFCAQTCITNAQCGAARCIGAKTGGASTCSVFSSAKSFCQP